MLPVTRHARQNISYRLAGLVSEAEVRDACARVSPQVGKTIVLVKRLGRTVALDEVSEGGIQIRGDCIFALIRRADERDRGAIATVMLRFEAQDERHLHQNHAMSSSS